MRLWVKLRLLKSKVKIEFRVKVKLRVARGGVSATELRGLMNSVR